MLSLDVIIFLIFLIINLSAGLFYSRGVTSIQQYAVGDRNFSTNTIVATIVASLLGGGFFSCSLIETYRQGLYYILPAMGDLLGIVLIGTFFVKRMGEFLGKLSVADAMGSLFGNKVRLVTALTGIIVSIGALGVQFKVASKILELVLVID
jgi:Na+/proline symporter